MDNNELIKNIKLTFEELTSRADSLAVKETITSVVRSVNRLQTSDTALNLLLRKISADLMKSYTNQVQYSDLKNKSENPGLKVKPEFDESFFKSLVILKNELFTLLEKL